MYHFLLFNGEKSPEEVAELEKVAEIHDCQVVCNYTNNGNEPPRGWFHCWNRGSPFDQATEGAVKFELETRGIKL